jgi:hypothetical protein
MREGKRTYDLPLSNVESARLVFEFGATASKARSPRPPRAAKAAAHDAKPGVNDSEPAATPRPAPMAKRH